MSRSLFVNPVVSPDSLFSPEKEPQQRVEAGEVVHMPMCDKDVADAQELARSKPAEFAEIEKLGTPLEYEIHLKPGIVERSLISVGSK